MSAPSAIKRALLGRPLATEEELQQRLPKKFALPVFASDAISSTAYATEEILLALVLAGAAATSLSFPIAIAVVVLLGFVALSYQQTVHAYPNGGGSYVVTKENLGLAPGMVAAASLLVDYVMTVAVSVASGVAAITTAFPVLYEERVIICVVLIILVALANLRGVRESGRFFAIPTFLFIVLCVGLIVVGGIRWATGTLDQVAPSPAGATLEGAALLWIVLRAFSGGCSAMTGTEAISNAVPAFKPPESKNASVTLGIMAATLAFLLLGVTGLSQILHVAPLDGTTVLAQVGHAVYGGGFFYYALQVATMAILILAANTSFTGFPRLSSVLARDGLMPRQFMNRGDKLVFSNGIIGLTVAAIAVLIIFKAETHSLIPLYAVGVFTSFTLSQTGMVIRWFRLRSPGWRHKAAMNGIGALMTGIVTCVVVATKFTHGAYIVVIAVPILVTLFYLVKRHYGRVAQALEPEGSVDLAALGVAALARPSTTVVVFVAQVNALTARSLALARSLAPDGVHVVTISNDPERASRLQETWQSLDLGIPLEVVESPYREFVRPAVEYVHSLEPAPGHTVAVIIPEFVVKHWWEALLHNQDAFRLKAALHRVPWVVVISIPLHVAVATDRRGPGEEAGEEAGDTPARGSDEE